MKNEKVGIQQNAVKAEVQNQILGLDTRQKLLSVRRVVNSEIICSPTASANAVSNYNNPYRPLLQITWHYLDIHETAGWAQKRVQTLD